jgi:hypothetical protein
MGRHASPKTQTIPHNRPPAACATGNQNAKPISIVALSNLVHYTCFSMRHSATSVSTTTHARPLHKSSWMPCATKYMITNKDSSTNTASMTPSLVPYSKPRLILVDPSYSKAASSRIGLELLSGGIPCSKYQPTQTGPTLLHGRPLDP